MPVKRLFLPGLLLSAYFLLCAFIPYSSQTYFPCIQALQDTVPQRDDSASYKIFERVEEEARFPGGEDGWRKFLETNLNAFVPVTNGAPAGQYTVFVQFVVEKDGSISEIKALTKHGFGMESEVIRILRKSPQWIPAVQNHRVVRAYRKQPVTFRVIEEKRKRRRS